MIKRIVKLTFKAEHTETFKGIFEQSQAQILAFEGCHHLELWQSTAEKNVFFTYSIWETEDALNAYRESDFFKGTWKRTKALFDAPPAAWSLKTLFN